MQSSLKYVEKLPSYILVAISLFGYLLLAIFFPLIPNYDRLPPADIRTFAPSLMHGALYTLLLLALFAVHALLYRRVSSTWRLSLKHVVGLTLVMGLPLLIMYPINANDVYRYVLRGMISSEFKANPFEQTPADFDGTLNSALGGEWADVTSPYGPLWELSASLLTSVGQENFLLNIVLFKLLGLFSLITAAIILWKILGLRTNEQDEFENRRMAFVVLLAWNPALLLSFVGNAHNDAFMIAVLLLGWFVINRRVYGPGFLLMLSAALIKPIALITLPIVFLFIWKELESNRDRVYFILWSIVGGTILIVLAFLPFGNPVALVTRLLSEASAGASFSPVTLIILLVRQIEATVSIGAIASIATVMFLFFYLWILWRTWRDRLAEQNLAFAFWAYVLQALNFRLWYAIWPFPWLLLDAYRGRRRSVFWLHAGLWFLVTSQLSVIIYGQLRITLFSGNHLLAHLVGVPFVFILPVILARYTTLVNASAGAEPGQITES